MAKTVLVTGSSRGIGRKTVEELARRGYQVVATMRSPATCVPFPDELADRITLKALDVSKPESITQVVDEMEVIDAVINNAGYGLYGPVELATDEEIYQQFDVNVFGVLRMIRAVLPKMRAQKSGHIVNISSIVGVVSNPFLGVYAATKHSIEALSAALATNVFPWNIKVSIVEPGSVATEFADVMPLSEKVEEDNPYMKVSQKYLEQLRERLHQGQPVEEVAILIADVIDNEHPDFRYQTSPDVHDLVAHFIKDTSGNQWVEEQKQMLESLF